jgi:GT2 family glycosyltransferase
MSPRARVIVATYNQAPYLERVLPGYLRQTTKDFRLVLADDGSGPQQVELVAEFARAFDKAGIEFEHVWHADDGWRKNHIMNEAVRRADDESLLIFSDGDCIPPAHFVEQHLAAHEPWSFHVAGAMRLSREESERVSAEDVEAGRHEPLGSDEDRRAMRKKARQSRWGTLVHRRNRPKVLGLNMAVDRPLFKAVNGFDERFVHPFVGEDTDLRDRLMRVRPRPRVKVLYTRNDVIHLWHDNPPRSREDSRDYYTRRRPVRCIVGLVPGEAP